MTTRAKTRLHVIFFAILLAVGLVGAQVLAESINGPFYTVEVKKTKKKDKNVAVITITGTNGYHCNMLYPWKLTVKPTSGVKTEKDTYKKGDAKTFTEKAVVFEVVYTAEAGKKASANLKMSLCNEKQCDRAKVDLTW